MDWWLEMQQYNANWSLEWMIDNVPSFIFYDKKCTVMIMSLHWEGFMLGNIKKFTKD